MTAATQNDDNGTSSPPPLTQGVFEQLVGEGRKFKSQEDLAKGKLESDKYVGKLEGENKELRDLLTKTAKEKEELEQKATFMKRINSGNDDHDDNGEATPNPTIVPDTKGTTPQGLSHNDVIKLMEERETNTRKQRNMVEVDKALVKHAGAEAKDFVARRAAELGISVEFLQATAEASPQAFYNLIGITGDSQGNSSLSARVNGANSAVGTPGGAVRDKGYYDKLKGQMGATKFVLDTKLQTQMYKDMDALGDRFFE